MGETEKYIRSLIIQQGFDSPDRFEAAFRDFVSDAENIDNVKSIRLLQEKMTKNWQVIARREEIRSLQIALPNGIKGKHYLAEFSFNHYGLDDITSYQLTGFDGTGLQYNAKEKTITGTPVNSGDIVLNLLYNFEGEPENAEPNHKNIVIIINPDPKSLWKNIPSDGNDQFAKPDDVSETVSFLGRTLVVSSRRGRSHANKGSFRDDDYAYAELNSGWGVIAISDGAGSAKYSRKGSAIACNAVTNYFKEKFSIPNTALLDEAIVSYLQDKIISVTLQDIAYPYLLAAAKKAYAEIEFLAKAIEVPVSDFHSTLSFILLKEFPEGWAFLSFGVGDCPMALVDKNFEWVKPLNVLDVGQFGGGTRFVTMPEILTGENPNKRFNFKFVIKLPYIVLMSDGIYDPKFEVEANLAKPEKWKSFFDDLNGNNSEGASLKFAVNNKGLELRLSQWMDFWSAGNHDDRTLAILF